MAGVWIMYVHAISEMVDLNKLHEASGESSFGKERERNFQI